MAITASEWLEWAIAFGVYPPGGTAQGSVTEVNTGTGLIGGPIISSGVISFAPIAAQSFWANATNSVAVPTVQTLSSITTGILSNVTGLGAQSQALNMNSHLINNVSTPLADTDAVNRAYVDNLALISTSVYAASAASLGTVTQSGAGVGATITNAGTQATFALDGVNPPLNSLVLIKNTATGMSSANEGIYTVTNVGSITTNWVLTRATTYDTAVDINDTGLIYIQNGSTLSSQAWVNTNTIVTVDTTAFNFIQFVSPGAKSVFSTYLSADQTAVTGDGTVATVICDTVVYDRNGDYNNSTGVMTASVTGLYVFNLLLQSGTYGSAHIQYNTWLVDNATTIYDFDFIPLPYPIIGTNDFQKTATIFIYLTAGQTIKPQFAVSGSTKTISILSGNPTHNCGTRFSGYLVA